MNTSETCFFKEASVSPVLGKLLILEFILGLIGNIMVLWVFCFRIPVWNTSTLYLFNVSLADFWLILCLPFRADYLLNGKDWHFGDIPCRIMQFMITLNRTGSIFFLTVVVIDRYLKVVHPHHKLNTIQTVPTGVAITISLWCVIFSLISYILTTSHLITGEKPNKTLCESFNLNWNGSIRITWNYIFFIVEVLVPLVIILLCTSYIVKELQRHKDNHGKIQKTIKSVTFVAFVFILCFLPSTLSTMVVVISKSMQECSLFEVSSLVFGPSFVLTYLNSMLNPLVIYFSSPIFQRELNMKNLYKSLMRKEAEDMGTALQHIT